MFHLILKHRKKIFLILPCCLLVILISFLSGNTFWSSLHAESSDRQFHTFTRSLFQTEVSANTISLHYTLRSPSDYGIADIPATYGSLSSDSVAAKASVRNVLSSLQEFDPDTLSSENALTFKILDTYLKNCIHRDRLSALSGASRPCIRYPYAAACSALGIQLLRHTGCRNLSGSLKRTLPILILSSGLSRKNAASGRITRTFEFFYHRIK